MDRRDIPPYYDLKPLARDLRRNQTPAEEALWQRLRGRRFLGLKFRRQHPISTFIVDFICLEKQLVIELDGSQHWEADKRREDRLRDRLLESLGLKVLRFPNESIRTELELVLSAIQKELS